MQKIAIKLLANYKKTIETLVKIGILYLLIVFCFKYFTSEHNWGTIGKTFIQSFQVSNFYFLALASLLVGGNWLLEAIKWRYLLRSSEKISLQTACKAILAGVSFSILTPGRIGDFAGRCLFLKRGRWNGIITTFISNLSQIVASGLLGGIAFLFCVHLLIGIDLSAATIPGIFLAGLFLFLMIAFWKRKEFQLNAKWKNKRMIRRLNVSLRIIGRVNWRDFAYILVLSATRYCVFCIQYILLLVFFGVDVPVMISVILVGGIFFSQTFLPAPAIIDIGVRNGLAIFFFEPFTTNLIGILAATTLLWTINLLLPALFGTLFVLKANIIKAGN